MQVHDLIGIGFGPSNVALAIALDERRQHGRGPEALFIERQPEFVWHPHMLLTQAHMQISFLKDLATMRNPCSRFTFVNYLHEKRRLPDFINLKTFFPSRIEFNDYLSWAASHFEDRCIYGEDVFEVQPVERNGIVELLRVLSRDAEGQVHERLARHLVVSIGGVANIPEQFLGLRGHPRVFHSSTYLRDIARQPAGGRVAVVGAGQSAAEIFMDLHGRPGAPAVDLVMRARSIRPSDDSPFVNEIFNADFVDHVHSRSQAERDALMREFWHTNYASPDLELIQQIFDVLYRQRVTGEARHDFLRRHEVTRVVADERGVHLGLRDLNTGNETIRRYDTVVLATGYLRNHHKTLLAPVARWLGDFSAERNYRLRTAPDFRPGIFLQGACEASHGLSDTLLSITAVRTGEIGAAVGRAMAERLAEAVPGDRTLSM